MSVPIDPVPHLPPGSPACTCGSLKITGWTLDRGQVVAVVCAICGRSRPL